MNLRRDRREPLADIVIELDDPADLFAVDERAVLSGARRIDSGIDELVELLLAQKRHSSVQRIVLDIAGEGSEELAANLEASVRRYCAMAVRRADRQHDLIWRQGMRSLISGSLLFVSGIGLSYLFTRPWVGELPGELLGNGVFLVVAWVGLWYPLDVLFIAREQAKRESRVFAMMLAMPVVVRTHAGAVTIEHRPGFTPSGGRRSTRLRDTHIRLRGAPPTGSPGPS
ncbi:hypothetical protein [Mycobacterium florentinum]|uniref:hypothetical protein n=1 Tax=Mycobacterium florentinum TaxID=292462 RepID=UPI00111C4F5E|nr:hypothetical protein [Mycobacterium florentinum]MCV7413594.1 hypothetical protein [Mycobacterium florentinum]BBX77183.1 hypothetical protein MFLOJ_09700 [Mycobacterium florentinum]